MTAEPMTPEELAAIRALWGDIRDGQTEQTGGMTMVPVAIDLLDSKLSKVFAEVKRLRADLAESDELLASADRDRARLRTENAIAWSEGHAAAMVANCDVRDKARADMAQFLVAEEQRCQAAINEDPTDPHLLGRLVGLQRARDIVTGAAVPTLEPPRPPAVGAVEPPASPDVDGWTISLHPDGVGVYDSTDHPALTGPMIPVGAVLALITDHEEDQTDA